MSQRGTLHVVATPIGNLADCSERLRTTLASCALVLCEDTRRTATLLRHLGVEVPMRTCHEHDESRRIPQVLERLGRGEDVALVSDAGTPCISDPGHRLVSAAVAEGFRVAPVPGPSAVATALSVCGLPTASFAFEGFLPRRRAARQKLLLALADEPRTLVFLESPQRLAESLAAIADAFGGTRRAFVGRELTKLHEELIHGPIGDIAARFDGTSPRGEIVVVVEGAEPVHAASPETVLARFEELRAGGVPERDAMRQAAKEHGLTRRDLYRMVKL